jgi:maltose-6'-phosphate glucosidase
MGAILGVDRHKLEVDYFGLNHFGWFTRVLVDGEDKLPELRRHIAKFGLLTEDAAKTDPQHSDPSWVKTWRNIQPLWIISQTICQTLFTVLPDAKPDCRTSGS